MRTKLQDAQTSCDPPYKPPSINKKEEPTMKTKFRLISLAAVFGLLLLAVLAALSAGARPTHAALTLLVDPASPHLAAPPAAAAADPTALTANPGPETGPALSNLALSFIANAGQEDPAVRFTVKGAGHTIFFTADEIVLSAAAAGTAVVHLRFPGSNPHPVIEGLAPLPGTANFYRGNDPAAWRTHVPTYEAVVYRELYPGVDLVYSGREGRLKSEFRLAAGADPRRIQMAYYGLTGISLQANGALALETPLGTLLEEAPLVYQERDGLQQPIPGRYLLLSAAAGERRVGFQVGQYDSSRPLVIDPELTYSSFLGGSSDEQARALDVLCRMATPHTPATTEIYVTGQTSSTNFPLLDPFDNSLGGQSDVFVTKFYSTSGTMAISYSTYLGGSARDDGRDILLNAVNADDETVYLTGSTDSSDFPIQGAPAEGATYGGNGDAFVVKLNPDGTLAYATYLGGSGIDEGHAIAFGQSSDIWGDATVYVVGRTDSTNFPVNVLDTTHNGGSDAFVTQVMDSGDEACVFGFSTYLGGSGNDVAYDVYELWPGRVHVTGRTESSDFPTHNALDATYGGNGDAFLTQILSTTTKVLWGYSTYLGGAGSDTGYGIYVFNESEPEAYVTGRTDSADFPTRKAFQPTLAGGSDAFVTKVVSRTADVALAYSSYLGGRGNDEGRAIGLARPLDGMVYVAGRTGSNDWPTVNAVQPRHGGGTDDAFVTQVVSRSGELLVAYSTPLGGRGNEAAYGLAWGIHGEWPNYTYAAYIAGWTDSVQWPTTANALDKTLDGRSDAFVAAVSQPGQAPLERTVVGPQQGSNVSVVGGAFTGYRGWDFGIPAGAVSLPATVYAAPYAPPAQTGGPVWTKYWTGIGSPPRAAGGSAEQSLPVDWLRPVTVTIAYDPDYFAGVDENDLRLYGQDAAGVWYDAACTTTQHPDCAGYIRDTVSDTITVTTLYVGKLALGVEPPEKAIFGRVTAGGPGRRTMALANVQISPDLGAAYAVTTAADGSYTLSRLISGTYTITPTLAGYTFEPPRYTVTITSTDVIGYDFVATGGPVNYTIYLPLVLRQH